MGSREINLDGGEISVVKALGIGGAELDGEALLQKLTGMDSAEAVDTVKGLIMLGYVNCDKNSLHSIEDFQAANFQVNPGYSKDLREALDPQSQQPVRRRVRRE